MGRNSPNPTTARATALRHGRPKSGGEHERPLWVEAVLKRSRANKAEKCFPYCPVCEGWTALVRGGSRDVGLLSKQFATTILCDAGFFESKFPATKQPLDDVILDWLAIVHLGSNKLLAVVTAVSGAMVINAMGGGGWFQLL
jgi:hypothetical protein